MLLSKKIKEARKRAGLTQKELGVRAGMSEAMIGQYETGYRRPKYKTLERIAAAMDLSVEYFLENRDDPDVHEILVEDFCASSYALLEKLRAVGWKELTCGEIGKYELSDGAGISFYVTEEALKQLDRETDSFMLYKLQELRNKGNG